MLCGGRTDPKRPTVSEASSIYDYAKPLIKRQVEVLLEEESITSSQNIEMCGRLVDMQQPVAVFCGNFKLPKIIWYVLHYWFRMDRERIAETLLSYLRENDAAHLTTEQVGRLAAKGVTYRNVSFVPYRMCSDVDEMLGSMMSDLVGVEGLYDRRVYDAFLEHVRKKLGLEAPAQVTHP